MSKRERDCDPYCDRNGGRSDEHGHRDRRDRRDSYDRRDSHDRRDSYRGSGHDGHWGGGYASSSGDMPAQGRWRHPPPPPAAAVPSRPAAAAAAPSRPAAAAAAPPPPPSAAAAAPQPPPYEELKSLLRAYLREHRACERGTRRDIVCPFTLRGLGNLVTSNRVRPEVYDRLASEYGWPSDPHAGSQTQKAPCTKAKCTHLQGLIQHANFVCGQHRPSSSFDDDDDEGGPPKVLVHKALEEVLREETHAPQPGAGVKAAEQKTERMPWPPMLFIKAQPCELEDSKDKLKTRFSKWGPDRLTPIYRGSPPQFTGAVVLTFGSATHEQLMKQSPGSDDVCAEQATAFDKARELHLLLLSKKCQEAARGISEVRYVTEPEWEQWKSVCARSVGKSTFWGRDLVGSGKWGEKMRVRWVDSREQHAKVEEARQTEREEQQRATAAAAAQAQAAQAAQAAAQQRASEEEEKRRELEEAQRARDESIQEQRQRLDKLAQQLGAQEQKTVLAQERQRTAEDKWRAVQQERDLLERNASELTDSMSRELARQERELREKQREVEQLSAGTAAAAAASGEVARKEAELQRLREDKAQSDREHKQKLQALDAELKEKEEAAEGSEFKFFRNDHLEMKNLRAEMYEQVKAVKKNECTNGLPPFKIFGELDQGEVTRLLFPKGVQPAQAEEMIYQNSALQNSFWSKDPGSTSSWPPFDPTKVFKLVRKVVDDKDVTEYLIAEEDEKIRKQTPQRGPDGRLTGAWVLEESEELKQDTTFTKYVRRRFGKKQGDAFLGYVLDKYREYVEYAGSLGHKADAVHRILWNYEQEREMTAMEMFRVLVPIIAY